jgi:hypothetical protein
MDAAGSFPDPSVNLLACQPLFNPEAAATWESRFFLSAVRHLGTAGTTTSYGYDGSNQLTSAGSTNYN